MSNKDFDQSTHLELLGRLVSMNAKGKLHHSYQGLCPDIVDPENPGDPECEVCLVIKEVSTFMKESEKC